MRSVSTPLFHCFNQFVASLLLGCACMAHSTTAQSQTIECGYEDLLWEEDTDFHAPRDLWKENNLLYVATYGALKIYDVTEPNEPILVASHFDSEGIFYGRGVVVNGIGYFAASSSGLSIVDLSNPNTPTHLSTLPTGSNAVDLEVSSGIAYVVNINDTLTAVDVSNNTNPTIISNTTTIDSPQRISLQGDYAFINSFSTFTCIDVSTPISPTVVYVDSSPVQITAFKPHGDIAYACARDGLRVYDIADPSQPTLLSTTPGTGPTTGISIHGKMLSCADFDEGLFTYDISTPETPELLGVRSQITEPTETLLVGDRCYVAGNRRLAAFDVSTPRQSPFISSLQPGKFPGITTSSKVNDNGLLFSLSNGSIRCVDISDPTTPIVVSDYTPINPTTAITVAGNYLYTTAAGVGVVTIDYTNPALPAEIGLFEYSFLFDEIQTTNNFLYFWNGDVLYGFNAANPGSLSQIGYVEVDDTSGDFAASATDGSRGYFLNTSGRIYMFQFTPSGDMIYLGEYNTGSYLGSGKAFISVSNGIAVYGSWSSTGFHIVDLTNPSFPQFLGTISPQETPEGAIIQGEKAYLLDGLLGSVEVVDLSNPAIPIKIGKFARNEYATTIAIHEDLCIFGDGIYGLRIVRTGACDVPCPADTNNDGQLTPTDFTAWVGAFNTNAPECDQNGDGMCTPTDFSAWIGNYNAGC